MHPSFAFYCLRMPLTFWTVDTSTISHATHQHVVRDAPMRRFILGVGLLTSGFLCGCSSSPKPCSINGTVTRGGEKMTWPDGGILLVIFFPEDRVTHPEVYAAQTDIATSTYTIAAIPPGRYKVAVQQFDTKFGDALNGAYDPTKTTLFFDVPPEGGVIDLDIPKADVTPPKREMRPAPPPPG